MPRMIDADCTKCSYKERDVFYMTVPEVLTHRTPEGETHVMEMLYLPRRTERTQWDLKDAVVVFRKPDGSYSYPAINTKPTPEGCERIVMRSLREVEKHEREAGVRNEAMWFDRNGRIDSNPGSVR